jgi:hypothetical protein
MTTNVTIKYNPCEHCVETMHITWSSIFDKSQQKDSWKSCGTINFQTDPRAVKFAQLSLKSAGTFCTVLMLLT